jgi:hypothetical protein
MAFEELVVKDNEDARTPPRVWDVVKASALHRLGKPLLLTYFALLVFGVVVVLGSVAWMRFGP